MYYVTHNKTKTKVFYRALQLNLLSLIVVMSPHTSMLQAKSDSEYGWYLARNYYGQSIVILQSFYTFFLLICVSLFIFTRLFEQSTQMLHDHDNSSGYNADTPTPQYYVSPWCCFYFNKIGAYLLLLTCVLCFLVDFDLIMRYCLLDLRFSMINFSHCEQYHSSV